MNSANHKNLCSAGGLCLEMPALDLDSIQMYDVICKEAIVSAVVAPTVKPLCRVIKTQLCFCRQISTLDHGSFLPMHVASVMDFARPDQKNANLSGTSQFILSSLGCYQLVLNIMPLDTIGQTLSQLE